MQYYNILDHITKIYIIINITYMTFYYIIPSKIIYKCTTVHNLDKIEEWDLPWKK